MHRKRHTEVIAEAKPRGAAVIFGYCDHVSNKWELNAYPSRDTQTRDFSYAAGKDRMLVIAKACVEAAARKQTPPRIYIQ